MANHSSEEERRRLIGQINEWNAHRLDLFGLSEPNQELEFHGVMRFYYQATGEKVATKCIRVSNTATTRDVLSTLIEKFRPDMRMLSLPKYGLHEVHVNGEERRLEDHEMPLLVQFNWGKDVREGRFLLKNEDEKTPNLHVDVLKGENPEPGQFNRKLSKREKKELKKKEKEAKIQGKENESPGTNVAKNLYNELPETSFTRSISNPENVMRRRRQQKLEKKLQQFKSRDGGPDTGGTLKIYGETIRPDVPYKTLLLSTTDTVAHVVRETLDKYGLNNENPGNYVLVQAMVPRADNIDPVVPKEYVLHEDDCPLSILMHTPPSAGTVIFQLRRRHPDMPRPKKKRSSSASRLDTRDVPSENPYAPFDSRATAQRKPPFLVEVNPDGSDIMRPRNFKLPHNVTEVGSEQSLARMGQYMWLQGGDIYPRHCVLTFTEGIVTVTPTSNEAETHVNGRRIQETTMLQHGMMVRFGMMHFYHFCDPSFEEKQKAAPGMRDSLQRDRPQSGNAGDPGFETTFDVDGHVETRADQQGDRPASIEREMGAKSNILPATIEYGEEREDQFLVGVIMDVNGNQVQFKLAPTYTLYMAVRYIFDRLSQPNVSPPERSHWMSNLCNRIANLTRQSIQESQDDAGALAFWMANASELLHFLKQDVDLVSHSREAQDLLAQAVQLAFDLLVSCMQQELHKTMLAFLDESMTDLQTEDEQGPTVHPSGQPTIEAVLQVLSSTMSLLRRCRVNAALTIQLFSQLFHFINMWLFNKVVVEPHLQLCTTAWGHRLKRRLGRVEIWAEKHGLELAADCHLARIIQAAHLLEAPKSNPDDVVNVSSACFKLNSLQLRALLENYIPGPGEARIPFDLINSVVAVAQNTADELTRSDGRDVHLEEEPDLQLPFLLPEDGYSCDIIKGVPSGLGEFLEPLVVNGLCHLTPHPEASGQWTVHMRSGADANQENLRAAGIAPKPAEKAPSPQSKGPAAAQTTPHGQTAPPGPPGPAKQHLAPDGLPTEPEVVAVTFPKVKGSIGLSIVAAMGQGQNERGIYVKSVVPGGGAAMDGRLQAGDLLIEVDGHNLIGLTQEKAAEIMTHTGHTVTLKIAKQGAIYHGLASTLSQPSPTLPRASPHLDNTPTKPRPRSDDASRFGLPVAESPRGPPGYNRESPMLVGQRPINLQHGARSSPHLSGTRTQERLPDQDPYGSYRPPGPPTQVPFPGAATPVDPREIAIRSKSTSHLDKPDTQANMYDPRQVTSTSTLPHSGSYPDNQQPGMRPHQQQPQQPAPQLQSYPGQKFASQPDLNRPREDQRGPARDYENFPQAEPPQKPPREDPASNNRYRAQELAQHPTYMNHADVGMHGRDPNAIKGSQSMGNLRGDPHQSNQNRPRSEEMDPGRIRDWQQLPQGQRQDLQDNRDPRSSFAQQQQQQQQPQQQQPQQPQQQQPSRPSMGQYDQRPISDSTDRTRPNIPTSTHPGNLPPEADPRRGGPQFQQPDPRGAPYGAYPGGPQPQTPTSQPHAIQGQHPPTSRAQSYKPSPQSDYAGQQQPSNSHYARVDKSSLGRYGQQHESPELPPPPPPGDQPTGPHGYPQDDLPPPPPPAPTDYDLQMKEEQDKMMKHWDSLGLQQPERGPPRSAADNRSAYMKGPQPGPQPPPPASSAPYSMPSLGPTQPRSPYESHPQHRPKQPPSGSQSDNVGSYHYAPRPAPAGDAKPSASPPQDSNKPQLSRPGPPPVPKKPPTVSAKPQLLAAEAQRKVNSSSPWDREERDNEQKRREDEIRMNQERQIQELQMKPYMTQEEKAHLQRLLLDQAFDKRAKEALNSNRDAEDDHDMIESSAGRAKMVQLMQQNAAMRQQKLEEEKVSQQYQDDRAERDKNERTERRLSQFDREREEQKIRAQHRQEKKVQETEDLLKRQREMREKQRLEFDEQKRIQHQEEEQQRERQREELRKKKEMEREQLREMQEMRDAEEAAMREQVRRQEEEVARQRTFDRSQGRDSPMKREFENRDKYQPQQPQQPTYQTDITGGHLPPIIQPNSHPNPKPGEPGGGPPVTPAYHAPAPPERKSSYDAYQSGNRTDPNQPPNGTPTGPPRSLNSSALRQNDLLGSGKKSVSFNTNLNEEIEMARYYGSTSSESSFQSQQRSSTSSMQESQYGYRGSTGSDQGPTTPTSPYNSGAPQTNDVFQDPHGQPNQMPPQQQPYTGDPRLLPPNHPPPPPPTQSYPDHHPNESQPGYHPQPDPVLVSGSTPGVVGAQEVYRDPRDRIAASRNNNSLMVGQAGERLSFRDKMRMFAKEAGETTPQEKAKISKAQQRIEINNLNGR